MFQPQHVLGASRRPLLALTALSCLTAMSSAQVLPVTTSSESARHAFEAGLARFSNVEFKEAGVLFDVALKTDPNFGLAHLFRAVVAPADQQDAFMLAASATNVTPGESKLIAAYASQLADERDRELELLVELHTEFPDDILVAQYLGNEYHNRGRSADAIPIFQGVIAGHPNFGGAYNMLGYAATATGDDVLAEKAFQDYIRLVPAEANPHDSLGEFYLDRGRLAEAEACFKNALAINPQFTNSTENLVRIAIQRQNRRFEECIAKKDADGLAALYTRTGQLLPPNEPTVEGRDAVRDYWKGFMEAGNYGLKIENLEVYPFGNTATELSTWTLTQDGETIDSGRCMIVWVKVGGEWLFHRDSWSSDRPVATPAH